MDIKINPMHTWPGDDNNISTLHEVIITCTLYSGKPHTAIFYVMADNEEHALKVLEDVQTAIVKVEF